MRFCLVAMMPTLLDAQNCCCEHEGGKGKTDPCCVEVHRLPDGQQPTPQPELPPVPVLDIAGPDAGITRDVAGPSATACPAAANLHGPAPPSLRRAMFAVWRL